MKAVLSLAILRLKRKKSREKDWNKRRKERKRRNSIKSYLDIILKMEVNQPYFLEMRRQTTVKKMKFSLLSKLKILPEVDQISNLVDCAKKFG